MKRQTLVKIGVLAPILLAAPLLHHRTSVAQDRGPATSAMKDARPDLGYSLIHGGVSSAREFKSFLLTDPVLNAWYGPCSEPIFYGTLPADRDVFTTYRRDGAIRWTKKRIHLKQGESYLVRCGRTILARCGNEISWSPQQPSEDILVGLLEKPMPADPIAKLELTPLGAPKTVPLPIAPDSPSVSSSAPPTLSVPCCDAFVPNGPPTKMPEPGTLGLVALGTLVIALLRFFR